MGLGTRIRPAVKGRNMKNFVELDQETFDQIWTHLLPIEREKEEAAFMLVRPKTSAATMHLCPVEIYLVKPEEFTHQQGHYLQLSDAARIKIIMAAHRLDASIIELHSHLGPQPAAFSLSDRIGLTETVPHMWWRLKGKPYGAIVVAETGFDALFWRDNPQKPEPLDGLCVDGRLLSPTNLSMEYWSMNGGP